MDYIQEIENCLGIKAKKFLPMQAGDVKITSADTSALEEWVNLNPQRQFLKE